MRTLLLIGSVLVLAGCSASARHGDAQPSGEQGSRDFTVGAFDRIQLAGSPDVIVTVGGQPSVRAEGDSETLQRLEIISEGGRLRIGMRDGSGGWFRRHRGVTVHVNVPSLAGAEISGSGDIRVDRVQGQRFAGAVTGSGDLEIATLAVGHADFSIRGSGGIKAAGRAEEANAAVTGSGDLDLAQLESGAATIALTGSGDIGIRATRAATIDLSGSGDVTVAGPARCTISKSGSGEVRCSG